MQRPASPLPDMAPADMPEDLRKLHAASTEVVGEAERIEVFAAHPDLYRWYQRGRDPGTRRHRGHADRLDQADAHLRPGYPRGQLPRAGGRATVNSVHCFDWVGHHSRRQPHDIAVANADSPFALTWAELEGRVARLAHLLADFGQVRRRDRVALLAENDARYFEVQFACIRLGAVFVPLNIRLSPAELRATLDDAGPRVLIHDTGLAALAADLSGPPGGLTRLQWDDSPNSTRTTG
jgi:non-ribosomal peptide synthetase component F